ncbi:MAG: uroporphyrinogen-III synthase [Pontixanthobacter sp.]
MRPILCIRPEPGLSQTLAIARQMGLRFTAVPLFEIEPIEWSLPASLEFDGLLFGSANAIRHGGAQLQELTHLPAFCVGKSTANAAEAAGFHVEAAGTGGLQGLLEGLRDRHLTLLRLAGEENVPLSPPPDCKIVENIVYRSVALNAPEEAKVLLESGAIVALHSAAAASHFASECNRMAVRKENISLAVLGPRIAHAAGEGWRSICIAQEPNDIALLAIIENMCQ